MSSLSAQQYMPHIDKGIYLTVALQEELATVSTFIAKLPWNHISRKNVGYLIAVLHGAEAVWDFDDSIIQTEPTTTTTAISNNTMSWVTNVTAQETVTVQQLCANVTAVANSFELVGVSTKPAWPRGFPVQRNKDTGIADALLACSEMTEAKFSKDIGVIHSLVTANLDVDAMHRLTVPQPVTIRHRDGNSVLQLPYRTLVPYNEQSTMHFHSALFALLLPTTVDSR
eukprot:19250-Heterococcus_DN1.PRE.2